MKLSDALNRAKPAKTIRSSSQAITEIDLVRPSFNILTELFLQDNRLTSLRNISQFPNLNRLALENNLLSDIEELQELRLLPKLREIRFKGNPIVNIPLFHEQIANLCRDYVIIDSKIVKFTNNKAKYENNILFALYLINFIKSIQKKPDMATLSRQLNLYFKKNNYIQFSHKIRYSYLKSDEKTYFYNLRTACSQKINEKCQNYKNFETLAGFIIQIIQSKLDYLDLKDLKKLNLPFFNNSMMDQPDYQLTPYSEVNNFYNSAYFDTIYISKPKIPQKQSGSTIPNASDYLSLVSFDFESSEKIDNSSKGTNDKTNRSDSSIRRALIKNDSKNYLSMPAIESDFSTVPCHRDIVFSEPFKVSSMNSPRRPDTLSIETSAEFSLIDPPEPPQHLLGDNQLLDFLNNQSSSSSVTTPRQSQVELSLSQSSPAASAQFNSPIIPSRQSNSFISEKGDSPNDVIDETLSPQKDQNPSSSNSNSPVRKRRRSNLKNDFHSNENSYNNNSNAVKSDAESTFTFETEDMPVIPSLLGTDNENDNSPKKRRRVRRKKVTFPEDSVSEAFLDE